MRQYVPGHFCGLDYAPGAVFPGNRVLDCLVDARSGDLERRRFSNLLVVRHRNLYRRLLFQRNNNKRVFLERDHHVREPVNRDLVLRP